ncbi:ABC transporter ATP-binding protein [Caldibacillus debilis]|uniref:ABC transporter ATP-binding protein n=1 Tax=Caldibacillus debilis TaxID=301148 RepID=UPI002FDAE76D
MEPLLQVKNFTAGFLTDNGILKAVDNISFSVGRGETVCIVGESGSGKSVTSLSLLRLLEYENGKVLDGEIIFDGKNLLECKKEELLRIRGKEIAMIFQEPMTALNPVFTIGRQITEAILLHTDCSKAEAAERAKELLTLVGISDPDMRLKQYPHELSGGMRQRVMIAMALACNPKLLIADEPTTALDMTIQVQILSLLKEIKEKLNMGIVLITHDISVAAEMADQIVVMYAGKVMEAGSALEILTEPRHPYTVGLLASVPTASTDKTKRLKSIGGSIPSLFEMPKGCRFHTRCPFRTERCMREEPPFHTAGQRRIACWHWDKIQKETGSETAAAAKAILRTAPAGAGKPEENAALPLVEVKNLKKYFPVKKGLFKSSSAFVRAVDDVSFSIREGETFGLVGESGSGKSTLGRTILKLHEPTAGEIYFQGKNLSEQKGKALRRIRKDMQLIFQDPFGSLNPRLTVGEIIAEMFRIHQAAEKREIDAEVCRLLEMVGIDPNRRHLYPHEFSGGQRQRIGIARAIALNPKFIVADEAVSALDVSVQAQILNLLKDLQEKMGLTYLFIAHGLNVVRYISDRVGVMYLGSLVEIAETEELFSHPAHPYTKALISANLEPDPRKKSSPIILKGEIPSPSDPPKGCKFHTRCPFATEKCKREAPEFKPLAADHSVACHYPLSS